MSGIFPGVLDSSFVVRDLGKWDSSVNVSSQVLTSKRLIFTVINHSYFNNGFPSIPYHVFVKLLTSLWQWQLSFGVALSPVLCCNVYTIIDIFQSNWLFYRLHVFQKKFTCYFYCGFGRLTLYYHSTWRVKQLMVETLVIMAGVTERKTHPSRHVQCARPPHPTSKYSPCVCLIKILCYRNLIFTQ